jgi:hypothetical protein
VNLRGAALSGFWRRKDNFEAKRECIYSALKQLAPKDIQTRFRQVIKFATGVMTARGAVAGAAQNVCTHAAQLISHSGARTIADGANIFLYIFHSAGLTQRPLCKDFFI